MKKFAGRFLRDNRGVTALEYGLIAGLIALLIVGGVTTIGTKLQTVFNDIANAITTPTTSS
jgi:pilus assembly protein Flp/PilA